MSERIRNLIHQAKRQGYIGEGVPIYQFEWYQKDSRLKHLSLTEPAREIDVYSPGSGQGIISLDCPPIWRNQLVAVALKQTNQTESDRLVIMLMTDYDPATYPLGSPNKSSGISKIKQVDETMVVLPPLTPIPLHEFRRNSLLAEAFRESIAAQLNSRSVQSWGRFLRFKGEQLPFGIWNELAARISRISPTTALTDAPPRPAPPRIILG